MPVDQKTAAVKFFVALSARLLTPIARAVAEAVMQAIIAPDSLIRVTLTDPEQISDVCARCMNVLETEGVLDLEKTRAGLRKGERTLELTNGSGIVFELEWTSPTTGKTITTRG